MTYKFFLMAHLKSSGVVSTFKIAVFKNTSNNMF